MINAERIDYFYYAMAMLTAANFVFFLICAHFYLYKGKQAADSPAGPERDSNGSTSEIDAALLRPISMEVSRVS